MKEKAGRSPHKIRELEELQTVVKYEFFTYQSYIQDQVVPGIVQEHNKTKSEIASKTAKVEHQLALFEDEINSDFSELQDVCKAKFGSITTSFKELRKKISENELQVPDLISESQAILLVKLRDQRNFMKSGLDSLEMTVQEQIKTLSDVLKAEIKIRQKREQKIVKSCNLVLDKLRKRVRGIEKQVASTEFVSHTEIANADISKQLKELQVRMELLEGKHEPNLTRSHTLNEYDRWNSHSDTNSIQTLSASRGDENAMLYAFVNRTNSLTSSKTKLSEDTWRRSFIAQINITSGDKSVLEVGTSYFMRHGQLKRVVSTRTQVAVLLESGECILVQRENKSFENESVIERNITDIWANTTNFYAITENGKCGTLFQESFDFFEFPLAKTTIHKFGGDDRTFYAIDESGNLFLWGILYIFGKTLFNIFLSKITFFLPNVTSLLGALGIGNVEAPKVIPIDFPVNDAKIVQNYVFIRGENSLGVTDGEKIELFDSKVEAFYVTNHENNDILFLKKEKSVEMLLVKFTSDNFSNIENFFTKLEFQSIRYPYHPLSVCSYPSNEIVAVIQSEKGLFHAIQQGNSEGQYECTAILLDESSMLLSTGTMPSKEEKDDDIPFGCFSEKTALWKFPKTQLIRHHTYTENPFRFDDTKSVKQSYREICTGTDHVVVLDEQGIVTVWGSNFKCQCGITKKMKRKKFFGRKTVISDVPPKVVKIPTKIPILESIEFIACGSYHTVAATTTTIYSWFSFSLLLIITSSTYIRGDGTSGKLGHGETGAERIPKKIKFFDTLENIKISNIYAGKNNSGCILCQGSSRLTFVWGTNCPFEKKTISTAKIPTKVDLDEEVVPKSLAFGTLHTLLVTTYGSLYGWGSNVNGQLLGKRSKSVYPAKIDTRDMYISSAYAYKKSSVILTDTKFVYQMQEDLKQIKFVSKRTKQHQTELINNMTLASTSIALSALGNIYVWSFPGKFEITPFFEPQNDSIPFKKIVSTVNEIWAVSQ